MDQYETQYIPRPKEQGVFRKIFSLVIVVALISGGFMLYRYYRLTQDCNTAVRQYNSLKTSNLAIHTAGELLEKTVRATPGFTQTASNQKLIRLADESLEHPREVIATTCNKQTDVQRIKAVNENLQAYNRNTKKNIDTLRKTYQSYLLVTAKQKYSDALAEINKQLQAVSTEIDNGNTNGIGAGIKSGIKTGVDEVKKAYQKIADQVNPSDYKSLEKATDQLQTLIQKLRDLFGPLLKSLGLQVSGHYQ